MKLAIIAAFIATATAFAPAPSTPAKFSLQSTPTEEETIATPNPESTIDADAIVANAAATSATTTTTPKITPLNGWTPNESLPCYGLPGSLPPTGYFDPLGFAQNGISLNEIKRNREAEVMHGRVAMIATVGYFVGESFPSPFGITGPANDQLQQMPLPAFILLSTAIAATELNRARIGWVEPDFGNWSKTLWKLREGYYPGDIGFDPLGFKPKDAKAFAGMQTRELQNGRLAMIGVAGMCAQELVNHRTIVGTIEFYQKVYSGIDPYAACGEGVIC
mmetsp:Transcript_24883/g.50915  ORF Transcript_24883/g.50915 Transcript_24883/m.50915 type:complete len:277 (+) Transcript_24883:46-876(+)